MPCNEWIKENIARNYGERVKIIEWEEPTEKYLDCSSLIAIPKTPFIPTTAIVRINIDYKESKTS